MHCLSKFQEDEKERLMYFGPFFEYNYNFQSIYTLFNFSKLVLVLLTRLAACLSGSTNTRNYT